MRIIDTLGPDTFRSRYPDLRGDVHFAMDFRAKT